MTKRTGIGRRRAVLGAALLVIATTGAGCYDRLPWCGYGYPYCLPVPPPSPPTTTLPTVPRPTTTTAPDTVAPSAPADLQAAPGERSITLTWTAASDTGGSGVRGYHVYRSTRGGPFEVVGGSVETVYTDQGLKQGSTYTYHVTAYDGAGNESAPSETASARPG